MDKIYKTHFYYSNKKDLLDKLLDLTELNQDSRSFKTLLKAFKVYELLKIAENNNLKAIKL